MTATELEIVIQEEILSSQGFVNIDKSDVDMLQSHSDFIDGHIAVSETKSIEKKLTDEINGLIDRHRESCPNGALLVFKVNNPSDLLMEDMGRISNALSNYDSLDIVWGISSDNTIHSGSVKLIILIGYRNNVKQTKQ